MLTMDPIQPDTFYLRIQNQEEQEQQLRKKEIVVRWSITPDKGLTWEYIRHEFFERPTLATDWTMTEAYRVELGHGLRALIESHLEWEFWREFTPSESPDQPRLPIDRRRLLQMLVAWRMSKMASVKTPQQAVDVLRQRLGGNISDLARRARTNRTSLLLTDAGVRNLSGSVMIRLAEVADQLMEWKASAVLRSHAMVASLNVSRRGGHR